jgi:AcrR family transcriptional regulator
LIPSPTFRKRGRPRSTAARDNVLRATLDLVEQQGYGPLTMEGIASYAGVSKQTLYRWWPTKGAVILEALFEQAADRLTEPQADCGSLQADLLHFLEAMLDVLGGTAGMMMRGLMAEAQRDSEFAAIFRVQFVARRRAILITLLEHGVDRGGISKENDFEMLADLTLGPIWYRLLNGHLTVDEAFVASLVTAVMRAAGAQA